MTPSFLTGTPPTKELAGKRILAVDDSPEITSLLTEVFTRAGAHVTAVQSGRDAMTFIALEHFDLVVLDLVMPKPDGWDVLHFLGRFRPELLKRTIVLTGRRYDRPTLEDLHRAHVRCVFKPFALDALCQAAVQTLADASPRIAA